ncbi:MAG TPA: beta-ketoacyl-[acyl-carrier-protein] synthase family protein [Kiritimatiellia bacterium]|nr:beta-ketoacyl-[acyl-carrier-protein] synthase family protein [Kiritimatiellia bacterium]HPS08090.1 beta-ketoacyl-[acyl-carrier-protein] synthase family protein [Kiritimatiellia bacterium]
MSAHDHKDERRAVVTGIGVVAANGIGVEAFWRTVKAGVSGAGPITLFDASKLPNRIAAEVKGFDPKSLFAASVKWKRMARHTQFAMAALDMALADAALGDCLAEATRPVCVTMGVSTSAIEVVESAANSVWKGDEARLRPWLVWASQPHAVTTTLSEQVGKQVAFQTVSTACKAGADAVLSAVSSIREGRAEIAIAGGADAPITASTCAAFSAGRLLSGRNDDPLHASRPFDRDRDGGVLGEGAGVLVLESLAHARARGARIWMEVCGGASCPDAFGTQAADGLGACMTLALANSRLSGSAIDYVCAHGPSDPVIDRVETAMIRSTLGRHANRIPVSSIKGVTGNPLAAAGPMELIACALALRDAIIPPTANYETPDPACDLDYVPQARRTRFEHALVNVHGMGGGNTTLIVRAPPS